MMYKCRKHIDLKKKTISGIATKMTCKSSRENGFSRRGEINTILQFNNTFINNVLFHTSTFVIVRSYLQNPTGSSIWKRSVQPQNENYNTTEV